MSKLSDSQLVVLSAACQRAGRSLYPLTLKVKGGAADKVLKSLLAKGLIEELQAGLNDEVWREDKDGTRLTLRATDAAVAALNIGSDTAAPVDDAADSPKPEKKARPAVKKPRPAAGKPTKTKKAAKTARKKVAAKTPRATRENTKQARLIEMLKRPKGASIDEIVEAFEWQPHTVRGAIAGALKKKLGLDVISERDEKRGRIYKLVD
jgi:DNA-binding MarR family transcriptional regulator